MNVTHDLSDGKNRKQTSEKDSKGGYKHFLTDNNSKNHTLYNNSYLENGEVVVLNDNDEIIIGRTVLRFNE